MNNFQIDEKLYDYLNTIIYKKSFSSYNGIIKRVHPRWVGWKYIDKLKKNKMLICETDLNDARNITFLKILDTMSLNFYIIMFLEKEFPVKTHEQSKK